MTEVPWRMWKLDGRRADRQVWRVEQARVDVAAVRVVDYICQALAESARWHRLPPLHIDEWEVAFAVDALPTVRERHPELLRLTELAGVRVVYPERPAVKPMTMTATAHAKCSCPPRDGRLCGWHWVWLQAELGFTDDERGITPLVDVRMDSQSWRSFHYEGTPD